MGLLEVLIVRLLVYSMVEVSVLAHFHMKSEYLLSKLFLLHAWFLYCVGNSVYQLLLMCSVTAVCER